MRGAWKSALIVAIALVLATGVLCAAFGNAFAGGEAMLRGVPTPLSKYTKAAYCGFSLYLVLNVSASMLAVRYFANLRPSVYLIRVALVVVAITIGSILLAQTVMFGESLSAIRPLVKMFDPLWWVRLFK